MATQETSPIINIVVFDRLDSPSGLVTIDKRIKLIPGDFGFYRDEKEQASGILLRQTGIYTDPNEFMLYIKVLYNSRTDFTFVAELPHYYTADREGLFHVIPKHAKSLTRLLNREGIYSGNPQDLIVAAEPLKPRLQTKEATWNSICDEGIGFGMALDYELKRSPEKTRSMINGAMHGNPKIYDTREELLYNPQLKKVE